MKTHRGIRGRVEAGKIGGGNTYGYSVVRQFGAHGEPIRGEREIDTAKADVILRIFREYAAGKAPQMIAADLNRDGIPSPTGKRWHDTTMRTMPWAIIAFSVRERLGLARPVSATSASSDPARARR